jgi:hypothetical protein
MCLKEVDRCEHWPSFLSQSFPPVSTLVFRQTKSYVKAVTKDPCNSRSSHRSGRRKSSCQSCCRLGQAKSCRVIVRIFQSSQIDCLTASSLSGHWSGISRLCKAAYFYYIGFNMDSCSVDLVSNLGYGWLSLIFNVVFSPLCLLRYFICANLLPLLLPSLC